MVMAEGFRATRECLKTLCTNFSLAVHRSSLHLFITENANIALPAVPLISSAIILLLFLFYMWTTKEPESSLQEPVSEEETTDSHVDGQDEERDPSESDIQGIKTTIEQETSPK